MNLTNNKNKRRKTKGANQSTITAFRLLWLASLIYVYIESGKLYRENYKQTGELHGYAVAQLNRP